MAKADDRRRVAFRLAGESGIDPRTIERWLSGSQVQRATDLALTKAAEELGIDLSEYKKGKQHE